MRRGVLVRRITIVIFLEENFFLALSFLKKKNSEKKIHKKAKRIAHLVLPPLFRLKYC